MSPREREFLETEYELTKSTMSGCDVFGIRIYQNKDGTNLTAQAPFVSLDKNDAQALLEKLERGNVGVITFPEVMEDYLIDRAKNSIKAVVI